MVLCLLSIIGRCAAHAVITESICAMASAAYAPAGGIRSVLFSRRRLIGGAAALFALCPVGCALCNEPRSDLPRRRFDAIIAAQEAGPSRPLQELNKRDGQ